MTKSLNIVNPESWYRMSPDIIKKAGGAGILRYWPQALQYSEPHFAWNWRKFSYSIKKAKQSWLLECMRVIFPDIAVEEERSIGFRENGTPLTIDVFVPKYNIAIEYQGEQHYQDVLPYHHASAQKRRDYEKFQQCEANGIHLVPLPYWWDLRVGSLRATIKHFIPHVPLKSSSRIHKPVLDVDQYKALDVDNLKCKVLQQPGEVITFGLFDEHRLRNDQYNASNSRRRSPQ
eukprot:CAMPEP_0168538096 /NCGR_PEP_ID=MMETSP0405-20121227/20852_1 /TAXON_ID=498012 /ORGANISM="Trichosphaerium sp, Strain Am-I-7 wt" /LENGTH=231 /DNA_ID=CAMNT_0008567049 /DNA_START=138 /DNA_END=830 /DNA_ORIENTATION=-